MAEETGEENNYSQLNFSPPPPEEWNHHKTDIKQPPLEDAAGGERNPNNQHHQIDIKPPPPPAVADDRFSFDLVADDLLKDPRVPFFRPLSQRKENTWLISLFVILYLGAFATTMIVNDCWQNSHGQCALRPLGRFSFQPLSENPLLGPSASALDEMGALRKTLLMEKHQLWRIFTSPALHAGLFHLVINISCVIFVGVHLQQEFGATRTGIIYILSTFTGSLVATLFLQDRPSVASSGALFGMLGAVLSGLMWNWKFYTKKFATLVVFSFILAMNLIIGLLPCVNNFSNIGGFISGFLLGFVLVFTPQRGKMAQKQKGLFDYKLRSTVNLRQQLERPVLRSTCLLVYGLLVAGLVVSALHGINVNNYCNWCKRIDCVPFKWWSCIDKPVLCEIMMSTGQLTLTCAENGNFRVFPFTNLSEARIDDLCYVICS